MGVGNSSVPPGFARLAGKRLGCALFDWQVVVLFSLTSGVLTVCVFYWFVVSFAVLAAFCAGCYFSGGCVSSPLSPRLNVKEQLPQSSFGAGAAGADTVYIGLLQRGGQLLN